jgi:cytoskeletal protein CcmA (bactofilin family)
MKKISNQMNAFLGKDTEFEGKLSFSGAVRIDGSFKGEILTEGTLVVGETANLEADVQASHIIVSGEVRGNIAAENRIEVHAPGKIVGNIEAPIITIDEGVVFEGNCRMQKQSEESEKDKKVAVLSPSAGLKNEN